MGQPEATAMMRADNRRLKGDLAKSRKMFGKTFTKIGSGIKSKLGGAFGRLGALGAGIGVVAIGKDVLDFEKTLTRLGIQAGTSAGDIDKFRSATIELSKKTGISRQELIGASEALVNLTGSAGFAQDKLEVLALANLATGASMEDLAGLAFSLESAFKLKNADELRAGLSAIITVGKEGSIPLGQLSSVMQGVSASFAELGGTGVSGATDLAAALQVMSTSFKGPAEAGTGMQAIITALSSKSVELGKKGVKVFDENGAFRGLRPILDDFENANLSIAEMSKLLGSIEAVKGIKALTDPEGRQKLEALKASAVAKTKALEEDAAKFRDSAAGRLQASMNRLKETFAAVFTPDRIEKFVQAMGKLADAAGFVVDHAKEFALIWASIKLAGFASQMSGIAGSMAGAAGSAGGLKAGLAGAVGKASALTAALAAGLAAGTALDNLFGISDKASDFAAEKFGVSKSFAQNKFLRQAARKVTGDQEGGAVDPAQALNNAQRLLFQARESGVLGEGGGTSRKAARGATSDENARLGASLGGVIERELKSRVDADKLIQAIEAAQRLVQESASQRSKGIDVRITIDDQGRISASGNERAQGAE